MSRKTYADYTKWYKSDEAKKFVIENIGKSGIPLELRGRKILKDNGFRVASARYLDPAGDNPDVDIDLGRGIWRELDLWATRVEKTPAAIGECEIRFATNIIGECKYSSEKDLVVFEHLDRDNADLSHFPLLVNGHCVLPSPLELNYSFFSLPLLVERLIEVNASSASKEKGNFSDMTMHSACEQILSALRYFFRRWRWITLLDQGGFFVASFLYIAKAFQVAEISGEAGIPHLSQLVRYTL